MDGLKGLPDAIKVVFLDVSIQTCIIHQIRNSFKYIASKDTKEFMRDLKCVYRASSEEIQNWSSSLAQLTIMFEDKIEA